MSDFVFPAGYNGIGVHDTPGANVAAWDYSTSLGHAATLKAHGVTLYKLFEVGGCKVERARAYVDSGIVTIVRPWVERPWGRGLPVTPGGEMAPYVAVGARFLELGNEWNIDCEWANGIGGQTPQSIAVEVVNWWEVCLGRAAEVPGLIPLFPAATPGGNVDHRLCYPAIRAELDKRGLLSTVRYVAIHPRPHNNPPWVQWSPTNTVTFDEWRWIRDTLAPDALYFATEHGYSLNDSQNGDYPPIDLGKWTDYNWTLSVRMDPEHADAIEPGLAGVCHWFEAGWGHWGAWTKDALVDSLDPQMPAPSPLWVEMGEHADSLAFERMTDTPEPPSEIVPGIDISWYQRSGVSWAAVAQHNSFVILRASVGLTLDAAVFGHTDQAVNAAPLVKRGYYHFLSKDYNATTQGRFFAALMFSLDSDIRPALDVEQAGVTAQNVRDFVGAFEADYGEPPAIYTRASFWNALGDLTDVSARCPLWVAHWDVDTPTLPNGWTDWLIWQYQISTGPEFPTRIDRDKMRVGTEPPEPPDEPPGDEIIRVTYVLGGPYVIGNCPTIDGLVCVGSQCTVAGSKPEHGVGGWLVTVPPGTYQLTVEGVVAGEVTTSEGTTAVVAWV